MFTLKARKVGLNCLAFSPDGRLLAASGYRGFVQVWNLADRKLAHEFQSGTGDIATVFFSPDGQEIRYLKAGRLRVCPTFGGKERICGGARRFAYSAGASPDGQTVCLAFGQSQYVTPNLESYSLPGFNLLWKQAKTGERMATALSHSRDGRRLAVGHLSGEVRVLDASTGALLHGPMPGLKSEIKDVALSPDGQLLAWCVASHLYLYRVPSSGAAEEIAHHSIGRTFFLAVSFHPSGKFFATVNGDGKADYWDGNTGAHVQAFDWGVGKLHDITFDPAGDRAACCAKTGEIVVWDVDR